MLFSTADFFDIALHTRPASEAFQALFFLCRQPKRVYLWMGQEVYGICDLVLPQGGSSSLSRQLVGACYLFSHFGGVLRQDIVLCENPFLPRGRHLGATISGPQPNHVLPSSLYKLPSLLHRMSSKLRPTNFARMSLTNLTDQWSQAVWCPVSNFADAVLTPLSVRCPLFFV